MRRRAAPWPWLALFLLALAMRSLDLGLIFDSGEVRFPYGADELYHLRRIWFSVVNFPASLDFDRYMNFPEGAPPIWSPLFDWSIAALARLLVGREDQGAVEWVAVWVPPLLGAATVIAAAALARRTFSPAAGWTAGVLLAVLPAHIGFSVLAAVDHHVAVGLGATLLLSAAMRLSRPAQAGRWPAGVVATGALAAGMLLLWPGSLLHVGVVQFVLVVQLLLERELAAAVARARALAALHGLAALLLTPFCLGKEWEQYGPLSPLVLSSFQPLWLVSGAVTLALLGMLWTRPALAATRPRRIVTALLLAAVGFASAWVAIPGLRAALVGAAGWFQADPFLAVISEIEPLLFSGGAFDPSAAHMRFSYLFWVYPVAAAWLLLEGARRGRADVTLLVIWSSAFFFAAALAQRRFNDSASVAFALVVGCAMAEGFRALCRRLGASRRIVAGALGALLIAASGPCALAQGRLVEESAAALRGQRIIESPILRQRRVLQRVARFLRRESPPTQGYLDPTLEPEYGVLSAWGNGHLLRYYGERPMVQDNFGPYCGRSGFDLARAYYASRSEAEATEIALRLGARYVVATMQGSGQTPVARGSMAAHLLLTRAGANTLSFRGSPLAHHRLVFATDDADLARGTGQRPWGAAVFEIVRGARVVGRAQAEALVGFELPLELSGGKRLHYAASALADAAGRYEIRLPYPTGASASTSARSGGSYAVRSGEHTLALALSESDIHEGRAVEGPSFEPTSPLP